jgi:hypothetical protein
MTDHKTSYNNSKDLFPYPSIEKLSRLLIGHKENNREWPSKSSNKIDIPIDFYIKEFKRQPYSNLQVKCMDVDISSIDGKNIYSNIIFLTRQLYFTEKYNYFRMLVLMCNNRLTIPIPIEIWLHIFSYIENISTDYIYHVIEYSEKRIGDILVPQITNSYIVK